MFVSGVSFKRGKMIQISEFLKILSCFCRNNVHNDHEKLRGRLTEWKLLAEEMDYDFMEVGL